MQCLQSDWFSAVADQRYHLLLANPPYIDPQDEHLQRGDLRFEPESALASGSDGLEDIRNIVAAAPGYLRPQGWLLLEHGYDQGNAVRRLLSGAGFDAVATRRDLAGQERISGGRLHAE